MPTTSTTGAPTTSTTASAGTSTQAAPGTSITTTLAPTTTVATTTTTTAPTSAPAVPVANIATVEVSVDRSWLSDPARVFPVALDPTYTTVATNAADAYGIDTFAWAAAPTTNYGTATALYVGNLGGAGATEAFIKFNNLVVSPSPTTVVTESHLMLLGGAANDCSKPVDVWGIDDTLSAATVWTNRPQPAGSRVSSTALAAGCGSAWNSFDTTSLVRSWITGGAANNGLRVTAADQADTAAVKWFWSGNTANPPLLYITYYLDSPPGYSTLVAPADGAVVATATPTLAATVTTDPDPGDVVRYWFRGTPAGDAESGARVVDSGWLTSTPAGTSCAAGQICYTVPVGAVTEGVTYYWHVWTADPYQWRLPQGAPFRFRAELGLGAKGPHPRDAMGPVSVNLASGNAVVGAASPGFATAGGTVGLAYTYNSQASAASGLTGSYYADPANTRTFPLPSVAGDMVRTDPTIDHYWGSDGPGLGIPADHFMVRWTGTITVQTTGSYVFAADHDDGMRIVIGPPGTTPILDNWNDGARTSPSEVASPVTLTAGVATPIVVEYYQSGGSAFATLSVTRPGTTEPTQVPPSWLSPDAAIASPVLARGWTLAPAGLSYASAVLGDRWVAFVDTSGALHTYTWHGPGPASSFTPPQGEDGVVGFDTTGAPTLHGSDGVDYVFDRAGRLVSATSALDDGGPGSVSSSSYTWSGANPRMTRITDPATGRFIELIYGPHGACGAGTPAGALCKIAYWDTTATVLTYSNDQLARIEDPGGVVTDFGYSPASGGRLDSVRSPLANDAVAPAATALTGRTNDASVQTVLTYEPAGARRVDTVTLPAPTLNAPRPAHRYLYDLGVPATQTTVQVRDGGSWALERTVSYTRDPAGALVVAATDAEGYPMGTSVHDAADRPAASIDPAGRKSTVTYDDDAPRAQASNRATHSYGPAPASCFGTDNKPKGTCTGETATPAHTAVTYDTDPLTGTALNGLAATYWAGRTLRPSGVPPVPPRHDLVVPAGPGYLVPANPPVPGVGAGDWSARYTGEVDLSVIGTYTFAVEVGGQARVYIDDGLLVDAWAGSPASNTYPNTFVGRHRIRVDYLTPTGGATPSLVLRWTPPGAGAATIPATALAPRYSVPTASVSDDTTAGVAFHSGDAVYEGLASRLVTTATADRGGPSQTATTTGYEVLGSGYRRPVSRTLGAGAGSTTLYAYYAGGESPATNTCANVATDQAKALKSATGATPASGGAVVRRFVYDSAGRLVGSSVAGDWTCTTYDTRGRVASVSIPPYGGEPAHVFTYDHAVGDNPLVASVTDTYTAGTPPQVVNRPGIRGGS